MSVSAIETREAKIELLLRPLKWAGHICWFGAMMALFMWFDRSISAETIAVVATAALCVTFGLVFWSLIRITKAARGQY